MSHWLPEAGKSFAPPQTKKKVDRFQRLSCIALFAQKVLVTRFTPIWKSCTEQRTQHSPDVQRALPVAVGFAVHARVGVPGAHWERVGSALGEPQGVWVLVWIPMPRTSAGLPRRARGAPDARQERAGGARGGSHLDQHSAHLRWAPRDGLVLGWWHFSRDHWPAPEIAWM